MKISFKNITLNEEKLYTIRFVIEEKKGDSSIKSTVSILLEDIQLHDGLPLCELPLCEIIEKAQKIALDTYNFKN